MAENELPERNAVNAPWTTCDWGDCDGSTVGYRNDEYGHGWLPVCQCHYDQEPDDTQVAKFITRADLAAPDADDLLQRIVDTPAGERIRMKCGAADLRSVITDILARVSSPDAVRQARRETWEAAEAIAKERAQEYAVRADTEIAAGNQSIADAWANWMKGAERTRQAIHAAALRAEGERREPL